MIFEYQFFLCLARGFIGYHAVNKAVSVIVTAFFSEMMVFFNDSVFFINRFFASQLTAEITVLCPEKKLKFHIGIVTEPIVKSVIKN